MSKTSCKNSGIGGMISYVICVYKNIPQDVVAVLARIIVGLVFWNSASRIRPSFCSPTSSNYR